MPGRHIQTWAILIGLGLIPPGLMAKGLESGKSLDCRASTGTQALSWQVSLDASRPVAMVNNLEAAAEYSASHVRILLPAEGHALFIGRVSGRLVVSTPDGVTIAAGLCT